MNSTIYFSKRGIKFFVAALAAGLFAVSTGADAHEGNLHSGHRSDMQMEKLHKMMPMFAQVQPKIDEALSRGDATAASAEIKRMLVAVEDLKKATPHKNRKQAGSFRKVAAAFEGDLKTAAARVNSGDIAGARVSFDSAKTRCDDCHAKFRD